MSSKRELRPPPLIEREAERARLLELFGATARGGTELRLPEPHEPHAVVIVGGAGVGKSRLMHECVPDLEALGFFPLPVVASPALRDVPFGALRQLLPPFDDEIGSWLRVLRDGTDRLHELAGDRQPLLVVDDLQELDPGSVALLLHALDPATVHLLGTLRSELRFRPHVVDMLKRFWGDRLAVRIDLAPLTREGTAALATSILGAPVDSMSVERLWSWTGGNPFLVRLVLADGFATETFDERAGLWQIDRGAVGHGLASAVAQTLHGLPEPALRVARMVAEADTLSIDVLVEAAGAEAVDVAEERELVTAAIGPAGESYRLTHPLYGDALLAQQTDEQRRSLRHALATAMITSAGSVEAVPNADRVLLALWYVDQQDLGSDAQFVLLDAARQSMRSWNHRAAVRFADPVWQANASIDAGLILCKAYDGLSMDDEACEVAAYLLEHARNDMERIIATIQLAGAETRRTGNLDRSRQILEESMARLDEPQWAAGLQIYLANLLMHDGRLDEALDLVEPIVEVDPDGFGAETIAVIAPIAIARGRIAEALDLALPLRRALAGGRELMAAQPWLVAVIVGLAELEDGRLEAARRSLAVAYDEGLTRGDVEIVGWTALQLARVRMLEGIDLDGAARLFREAAAALGQLIGPRYVAWALGGLAGALALLGDLDGARIAAAGFDDAPPHSVRFFHAAAEHERAWVEVLEGDQARALALLDAAALAAQAAGEWVNEAACLHDLARIGYAEPEPDAVSASDARRRLAESLQVVRRMAAVSARPGVQSALVRARADHVRALADDGDATAFAEVAGAFAGMGAKVLSAEAWAGAATQHRHEGDDRGAARATLRAHALLAGRSGPPTPLLIGLAAVRMTERQETVARLAAAGVSRQAMADRCFVSLRTIDRHLDDAFGVLGVRTKDDLAAALAEYDLARGVVVTSDADELLDGLAASASPRRPPGVPRLTHRELDIQDGRVTVGPVHESTAEGRGRAPSAPEPGE